MTHARPAAEFPPSPRIGELLRHIVPLSGHDVEEVLREQAGTRRRFGEAALSLGLCRPEHVWRAFVDQVSSQSASARRVNLAEAGVDAQAVAALPGAAAVACAAVPLRCVGGDLLVAVAEPPTDAALASLESAARRRVVWVLADARAVGDAVRRYYPVAADPKAA